MIDYDRLLHTHDNKEYDEYNNILYGQLSYIVQRKTEKNVNIRKFKLSGRSLQVSVIESVWCTQHRIIFLQVIRYTKKSF